MGRPDLLPDNMFSDLTICLNTQAAEPRFAPDERAILLATPGIGPGVIQRLEEAPMATSNSSTRGRVKFPQARTLGSVSQSAESLMARRWAASLSR